MKRLFSKLAGGFLFLYAIGMLGTLWFLYDLPTRISNIIPMREVQANALQEVLDESLLATFTALFVGLMCILLIFLGRERKTVEKIVYVDRISSQKDETAESSTENDTHSDQNHDDILQQIKETDNTESQLRTLCKAIKAVQGVLYVTEEADGSRHIISKESYALSLAESDHIRFEYGEGIIGQVAKEGKALNVQKIPEGHMMVRSGLGESYPKHLYATPIIVDGQVTGVLEIATFKGMSKEDISLISNAAPTFSISPQLQEA